jgi:hypothetical protein
MRNPGRGLIRVITNVEDLAGARLDRRPPVRLLAEPHFIQCSRDAVDEV